MYKFYLELGEIFLRLPVGNMYRFYENLQKLDQAEDAREAALRIMNFSDYTIEGPGDKFGGGASSSSSSSSGTPSKPTKKTQGARKSRS